MWIKDFILSISQTLSTIAISMFQFSSFIPLEFFFHINLHIISNFWSIRSQFDSFQCEELFSAKYKIATGTLLNKEFIPQNWISNQIFFIIWAANSKYYKYYEWEHQTANTRGGKKTGWLRKHKTHQHGSLYFVYLWGQSFHFIPKYLLCCGICFDLMNKKRVAICWLWSQMNVWIL